MTEKTHHVSEKKKHIAEAIKRAESYLDKETLSNLQKSITPKTYLDFVKKALDNAL